MRRENDVILQNERSPAGGVIPRPDPLLQLSQVRRLQEHGVAPSPPAVPAQQLQHLHVIGPRPPPVHLHPELHPASPGEAGRGEGGEEAREGGGAVVGENGDRHICGM